jgi:hypothetical protein
MIRRDSQPVYEMAIVTDPEENAQARALQTQLEANVEWLDAHAAEVYSHRGRYICIAGRQLFVADSLDEVLVQATAAHPDDLGCYVRYIPREKVPRVYAHQR